MPTAQPGASPKSTRRIRLVVPGNVLHNSGGNVYNAALTERLIALGVEVDTYRVDGEWPIGSEADRRRFGSLLSELAVEDRTAVTIVDGLVASGAPEEMERSAAEGRPVWVLLHMPLKTPEVEGPALERRTLAAAAGVMTTSSSVAAMVRERHGIDGVTAALPGTEPAPLALGSNPPHLIAVAALLPNKDQLILLGALAQLTDLPWTASLIGSDSADEGYANEVRAAVERLGVDSRVRLAGELGGEEFDAEWKAADLSLLVSRAEAYGLVVPESLAHGLPVIVRAGTGAVEALHAGSTQGNDEEAGGERERGTLPGTAVGLDTDPTPLAEVLRSWLTEPGLRTKWRTAALAARERLPGWEDTARTVLDAVDREALQREESGRR
ncbi:glycosyltransferase family 4 protein [Arthrobacter sp.]|uniref:glycosyltransferase family 4 protein n=1 Tax=Arthrobacter sp. TaxID=1667 RepID=UPI002810C5CD|nr:glycosyltransferase family 4 protein [Arthrobacter sp.]